MLASRRAFAACQRVRHSCSPTPSSSLPSCTSTTQHGVWQRPRGRTFLTNVFNMAKGFGAQLQPLLGPKMLNKKPLLVPRKVTPRLPVPSNIKKAPYADSGVMPPWSEKNQVHDAEGVKRMRASGRLAAQVLAMAGAMAKPGVTTDEIDVAVHAMILAAGAYPSPLNYGGFPKSVCTSVNECVCHGIPDDRPLEEGDIVNIDVTVFLNGYHGDTSGMFYVGQVDPAAQKLCEVTKQALDEAIKICKRGVPYNRIGSVINDIADKHKFGVIKEYTGHGVGQSFHSGPSIMHFRNTNPGVMKLWQTFTIEPMLVQGRIKCKTWDDKWTVVTADGGLAAQYEHTILITPDGHEIMTKLD